MKIIKYIMLSCFVLLLMSCSSGQNELVSIVITMTDSQDVYTVTDKAQMESIDEIITLYAKLDGIVDMITPAPVELTMNYSDDSFRLINLYIYETDKRSSLTYAEDDTMIYQTTEDVTNRLKSTLNDVIGN